MTLLLLGLLPFITTGHNDQKADSIINAISILQNDSVRINKIVEYSAFLLQTPEKSYPFFQSELIRIEKKNNLKDLAIIYELLALSKYYSQEYDSAIFFTKKQMPYVQKINDSLRLFRAINRSAVLYDYISDYPTSISYYIEALKIANQLKNSKFIMATKINLGGLYLKMGRYHESLKQFKEAQFILDTAKNEDEMYSVAILLNLGAIYLELNILDSAYIFSKKSLELAIKYGKDDYASLNYGNLSRILRKKQIIDSSLYYQYKSYEIKEKLSDYRGMAESLLFIIETYTDNQQFSKASKMKHKLTFILPKIEDPDLLESVYYILASLNANTHNYKTAYEEILKALYLKDTILNERKQQQILDLETKYQTQQKENEILRLNNENFEKKAALAQSKLLNISGIGFLILLVGLGLFFWQRRKQQLKLALIQNSIQATEIEKKRIGKELHDGLAGTLIKLSKDAEQKDLYLSDQLLSTYNEVRNLSHQLDNSPIHGEKFMDRLIDLIPQDSLVQHFSFKITPLTLELSEPVGTHIYRIIQELIANNLKHANATKTKLVISLENGKLNLTYEDNGIGIGELKKGNGFKNIESRLELMNGSIKWPDNFSPGLKLEIQIPYHRYEKN